MLRVDDAEGVQIVARRIPDSGGRTGAELSGWVRGKSMEHKLYYQGRVRWTQLFSYWHGRYTRSVASTAGASLGGALLATGRNAPYVQVKLCIERPLVPDRCGSESGYF